MVILWFWHTLKRLRTLRLEQKCKGTWNVADKLPVHGLFGLGLQCSSNPLFSTFYALGPHLNTSERWELQVSARSPPHSADSNSQPLSIHLLTMSWKLLTKRRRLPSAVPRQTRAVSLLWVLGSNMRTTIDPLKPPSPGVNTPGRWLKLL